MSKTTTIKKAEVKPSWVVIDASNIRLGRLASFVAKRLQGKHQSRYVSYIDTGDHVVVINSTKVDIHPSKLDRKRYWRHSGYPGGLKMLTLKEMLERKPNEVIRKAIWGMMPKTKLGRAMIGKLYIYEDEEHNHTAQKPKLIKLN